MPVDTNCSRKHIENQRDKYGFVVTSNCCVFQEEISQFHIFLTHVIDDHFAPVKIFCVFRLINPELNQLLSHITDKSHGFTAQTQKALGT